MAFCSYYFNASATLLPLLLGGHRAQHIISKQTFVKTIICDDNSRVVLVKALDVGTAAEEAKACMYVFPKEPSQYPMLADSLSKPVPGMIVVEVILKSRRETSKTSCCHSRRPVGTTPCMPSEPHNWGRPSIGTNRLSSGETVCVEVLLRESCCRRECRRRRL